MASACVTRSQLGNYESLPKKLRCPSWTSSPAIPASCRKRSFSQDLQSPSPFLPAAKKICFRDNQDSQGDASRQRSSHPASKEEWVELMIKEMMGAASIDDAKSRAAKLLENLEKFISAIVNVRAETEAAAASRSLQERIETMAKENCILKRGIAIQHQRQKDYDDRSQEVKQLKEAVAKYQEKARALEVNNYALTMHLQQALHSNSVPDRFHPDVF